MPTMDDIRRGGTPFDAFLYAAVGEDRNGNTVTVLSALARLGLEPWQAASELAALTGEEARNRLDGLLTRLRDVPALGQDHAAIARRLIALLPNAAAVAAGGATQRAVPAGRLGTGVVIALLMLFVYLVYTLLLGPSGAGG